VNHFLKLIDVDFLHVFLTLRPLPGPQTHHTADNLSNALQEKEKASCRDERLERIDRWTVGHERRVLLDGDGIRCVVPSCPDQGNHARYEKYDVQNEVNACLTPGG